MGLNILKKIAKTSLELLGLLLELLLELLLLALYAFYHVLKRGREAPPCNYVINAYSSTAETAAAPAAAPTAAPAAPGTFWQFFSNVQTHLAQTHLAFPDLVQVVEEVLHNYLRASHGSNLQSGAQPFHLSLCTPDLIIKTLS